MLYGDDMGNPIDGRRWLLTCFDQWKKEDDNDGFTGPCIFKPTYVGCRRRMNGCDGNTMCNGTECEQMFETPNLSKRLRINNACNIGFLGDDPKVSRKHLVT